MKFIHDVHFFSLELKDNQLSNLHLHLFLIKNCWGVCTYLQQPERGIARVMKLLRLLGSSLYSHLTVTQQDTTFCISL